MECGPRDSEISAQKNGTPDAAHCSASGSAKLLAHAFNKDAILKKRLPYERLDQLMMEILLGVR